MARGGYAKAIARLKAIDEMIRAGGWSQERMAKELGVSDRTVRYYFDELRGMGAPLRCRGRNGWEYSEEWELKL